MSLDAPSLSAHELRDRLESRPVSEREVLLEGMVWDVVRDTVDLGEAGTVRREYVLHPGAVGTVAMDDKGRILLVQQYRHPVGHYDWELPAGLLDVEGEPPWEAAARELHEEADLTAATWNVLVDHFASPGGLSEVLRLFLARDLTSVPHEERHQREAEEHGMPVRWVDLNEAVAAVLTGRLHNPAAIIGILTAYAARELDWGTLRPYDAPWPEHPAYR